MLSDEELQVSNREGIFPAPQDTYESYCQRVLRLRQNKTISSPPSLLQELYDVNPQWVEVVHSNKQLHFWEAACNWLEGDRTWIQVRKNFEKKEKLFGLYAKEEVLAHEYVHAVRALLGSEKYEEHFAYYVSRDFGNCFRATMGPCFSNPLDAKILLLSLFTFPCLLFAELFPTTISLIIPCCTLAFLGGRLFWRWRVWHRCRRRIGLALMIRLTDEELEHLSQLTPLQIQDWISEAQKTSFRWQQLSKWYRL
jgi:hypothetical protein